MGVQAPRPIIDTFYPPRSVADGELNLSNEPLTRAQVLAARVSVPPPDRFDFDVI